MFCYNGSDSERVLSIMYPKTDRIGRPSVLVSPRNGGIGLLRKKLGNPKLFSHPHRLVLAAKVGQNYIPDDIEQTVSETLFFKGQCCPSK